jgi:hypothetical protein
MESAIVNLTSPGDEIIVVIGGTFSERWKSIADAYGLTVRVVVVDWRRGANPAEIQKGLDQWPNARVVFITWSESSTGVLIDLDEIGKLVRSQDKISLPSFRAVFLRCEWTMSYAVVVGSRGLMLPRPRGYRVGPRAWANGASRTPRFYWDRSVQEECSAFPGAPCCFADAALESHRRKKRRFSPAAPGRGTHAQLVRQNGERLMRPGNGIRRHSTGRVRYRGLDTACWTIWHSIGDGRPDQEFRFRLVMSAT